ARNGLRPLTMTCDAMSPFEYGRPGSRSEMTTCGILLVSLIASCSSLSRSSFLARRLRRAALVPASRELEGLRHESGEGRIGGAVVHHDDLRPAGHCPLCGHVDGGSLQLGQEQVVAFGLVHVLFQPLPVGE